MYNISICSLYTTGLVASDVVLVLAIVGQTIYYEM
jgi:hypothetical protein